MDCKALSIAPALPREGLNPRRTHQGEALDLTMQLEVTARTGVGGSTVWNWEHGTELELIHILAVLAFLGYVPWEGTKEGGKE